MVNGQREGVAVCALHSCGKNWPVCFYINSFVGTKLQMLKNRVCDFRSFVEHCKDHVMHYEPSEFTQVEICNAEFELYHRLHSLNSVNDGTLIVEWNIDYYRKPTCTFLHIGFTSSF